MVDLIRSIYCNLLTHPGPRQVLTSVLRVTPDVIEEFDKAIRATNDTRRQRKLVRNLLQDVTGVRGGRREGCGVGDAAGERSLTARVFVVACWLLFACV